jgi:hypothetical protein
VPYPDLAEASDLRAALQAEFDAADLASRAEHFSLPGDHYVAAALRSAERNAIVIMSKDEPVFYLQFLMRGVAMAGGRTDALPAASRAMHAWHSGMPVGPLMTMFPFLGTNEFALAFERSEADAIENRWRQFHTPPVFPVRLRPVIALAFTEPRLRALLPYLSGDALRFSRTAGYPFTKDCPMIEPLGEGRYLVRAADGREIGTADAAGSVALVLASLDEEPT